MSEVPTLCLDHLTPAQARAFMIAENKLVENADWNDQLLAQQLKELIGLDFSLELTGFEMGEIDLRIQSLEEVGDRVDDPADAVPEVLAGPAISKIGDQWLLGHHRLLCGTALDTPAFTALMGAERASVVFTDPPYNVPINSHREGAMVDRAQTAGVTTCPTFLTFFRELVEICYLGVWIGCARSPANFRNGRTGRSRRAGR
jgi:hypothetical protein